MLVRKNWKTVQVAISSEQHGQQLGQPLKKNFPVGIFFLKKNQAFPGAISFVFSLEESSPPPTKKTEKIEFFPTCGELEAELRKKFCKMVQFSTKKKLDKKTLLQQPKVGLKHNWAF